jgi:hypothetical protein
MDNGAIISHLNPTFVFDKARVLLPQYNTKFAGDWTEQEARKPWQTAATYWQKWQTNDVLRWQFISNVAPIKVQFYDCKGLKVGTPLQFTQKQQNKYYPGFYIYEASYALAGLPRGRYRSEFTFGDPVIATLEGDFYDIAENWPNTVLAEYTNSFYYADAIFETGWLPNFRVEGWFKLQPPAARDELYEDQVLNQTMLFSDPYKVWEFIIGPSGGVPDWVVEKLNWIFGCDELFLDGKQFTKDNGAKFTEVEFERYPYRGWSINLRETARRSSSLFPIDPTTGGKKLLVALNVETDGFADTTIGSSSNVIQISTVETN